MSSNRRVYTQNNASSMHIINQFFHEYIVLLADLGFIETNSCWDLFVIVGFYYNFKNVRTPTIYSHDKKFSSFASVNNGDCSIWIVLRTRTQIYRYVFISIFKLSFVQNVCLESKLGIGFVYSIIELSSYQCMVMTMNKT